MKRIVAIFSVLFIGCVSFSARGDDGFAAGFIDNSPVPSARAAEPSRPDPRQMLQERAPELPESRSDKELPPPMAIPSVTFPYDVRQPVGVLQYYPADARELRRQLAALDTPEALEPVPGVAKVFYAPWGAIDGALPVAAKVYRYLRGLKNVKTIVMVSRPHGDHLAGPASVWPQGGYATPLGIAKVNALAARRLAAHPDVNFERLAHLSDPAIETNVILAQYFLPDAMIVPVYVNPLTRGDFEGLCQLLSRIVSGEGVVMVAIGNLSYGFPEKDLAGKNDLETISALQTLDLNVINGIGKKRSAQLVDGAGIMDSPKVMMAGVLTGLFLEMDTLTWFGYDAPRQQPFAPLLTGCAAGAFSARARKVTETGNAGGLPQVSVDAGRLSDAAVKELHGIARDSLEAAAAMARYDTPYPRSAELLKQRAAFVTVLGADNREIACMGSFDYRQRLCAAVAEAARMCAVGEDPQRVGRLTAREAKEGKILISVIKNPRMAGSWTEIKNGQGVLVARGTQRSVVLPATALRRHWNVEDMLAFACRRAGLKPDAYRDDRVDIMVFDTDEY